MISDHEGIVRIAQQGRTPHHLKPVGDEPCVATAGEGVPFEWRRRDQTPGQRLAHKLARDAAKGR
jgi:hypothetical protein